MHLTERKYLFICACARSGTSITTELLKRHPKIAMGKERFNSLFKRHRENYTPSLFNAVRFCKTLLPHDTHHSKLDQYYDKKYSTWNQHIYCSDKIPSLFKKYEYLIETFSSPKIIFLIRNIFDVSLSWETIRMRSLNLNGKWPHQRGFLAAAHEWNLSLNNTIVAKKKYLDNIFILPFRNLFGEIRTLDSLFDYLDLSVIPRVEIFWKENRIKKEVLEKEISLKMPTEIKETICLKGDFEAYRLLNKLASI